MAGRPIIKIHLSAQGRYLLEDLVENGSLRERLRAQIVLCRESGMTQEETAKQLKCSMVTVSKWTAHFRKHGVDGFRDQSNSKKEVKGRRKEATPEEQDNPSANAKTVREIAHRAKVSVATVSRVINHLPNVRKEVSDRVWAAAVEIGYRPDPELRKLMVHLRKNHVKRLRGRICLLEAAGWQPSFDGYFRSVVSGARQRAEALGFSWERFSIEEFLARPKAVSTLLYNRGVEGLLIPPVPLVFGMETKGFPETVEWNRFSVVFATHSLAMAHFRRVVPDQFKNLLLICHKLKDLGYNRLGLLISDSLDMAAMRRFSGAFAAFHVETKRDPIIPFNYKHATDHSWLSKAPFINWVKAERPDALIVNSGRMAQLLKKELNRHGFGNVGIASLALLEPETSGIDERPSIVGALAAEELVKMITHGEKGIPEYPTVTLIEGLWKKGSTALRKKW